MQLSNAPLKLTLPFANAGGKTTIPVASQVGITPGAASLTDGFPPLTRTPVASGGIPPSGLDMNGILFEATAISRWNNAGAGYVYDATFAADSDVGGYPKGARVLRTDGEGYWLCVADNTATDPEAGGAGWVPDYTSGAATVAMSNANVTLTSLQAGRPIITITGTLIANLNLVFPTYVKSWIVVNNASGAYSVTCKTSTGTGVAVAAGTQASVVGDGTNIVGVAATVTVANDPTYADNSIKAASTGWVRGAMSAIATAAGFAVSLGASGYVKLPSWLGGIILQWGAGVGGTQVTLPVAFNNTNYKIVASATSPSSGGYAGPATESTNLRTASAFTVYTFQSDGSGYTGAFNYIGIGY